MPVGAIVLGGAHGSLAVARSLGRHGVPVLFVTHDHPIAKFSRHTTRHAAWGGPEDAAALDQLKAFAAQGFAGWVLIPSGDGEVRFVAQNHAALAPLFRLTTPAWDTVQWAGDKRLTYRRAAMLGIPVPRSFYPRNAAEAAAIDTRFPAILKPTQRAAPNAFTRAKAWQVDNREALVARYAQATALVPAETISVQELIPGGGELQFSFAAVCVDGAPIGSLVARRTRQYPIDFGFTSSFVETVANSEVERLARRFLASLNYSGLAEVEFKYDTREGVYKLLDFNARPWTWIGLGAAAGVDFPWLLWRIAVGESVAPCAAKPGHAWMHLSRDVVAAIQEMQAGRTTLRRYLASLAHPTTFAAFRWSDPVPGVVDLVLTLWRNLWRLKPRRSRETAVPPPAAEQPAVERPAPWRNKTPDDARPRAGASVQ